MPTPATAKWPRPKSEDEWEDMVLDAMRLRWRDPNAQRHGRRGQRQNGVDIFGQSERANVGAQAKNTDELSESDALAEINKAELFKPKLDGYFLVVGGLRDANMQTFVRRLSARRKPAGLFDVHILFFEDVCDELSTSPTLVRKYWGAFLAAVAFVDALPTILTNPVLDYETASTLLWELPQFAELAAFLEEQSGGATHASLRLEGAPQLDAPRGSRDRAWHLAVAESHETHLVTLCRMAVDVDTGEVSFYSVVEDRWLTRDEWLQTQLWFI